MSEPQKSTIISFGKDKEAALYFDYVLPFLYSEEMTDENRSILEEEKEFNKLKKLIPPQIISKLVEESYELLGRFISKELEDKYHFTERAALSTFMAHFQLIYPYQNKPEFFDDFDFNIVLNNLIEKFELQNAPIILPPEIVLIQRNENKLIEYDKSLISLLDIPLINTDELTWEHILKFREDKKSAKKLKRFRLFFYENYKDKDIHFIEDDLSQRLDDYARTVKEWGFKNKLSYISIFLDSKTLQTTALATLLTAVFGNPFVSASTAIGGCILELSKVTLNVIKSKHELKEFILNHDLGYIIEAKNKLEPIK